MKRYNICVPRKYKDGNGNEKTHWWTVGSMIPMRERDGYSIQMYSPLLALPRDAKLVAFVDVEKEKEERENKQEEDTDDDIPF